MLAPVPESAFAAQNHNLRTVAPRYQATARATELCRSATPAEQSSAFVRSVYVVARVNTHVVARLVALYPTHSYPFLLSIGVDQLDACSPRVVRVMSRVLRM